MANMQDAVRDWLLARAFALPSELIKTRTVAEGVQRLRAVADEAEMRLQHKNWPSKE